VEAELFHADVRKKKTDMTKLTVAFRNFENAPEQQRELFYHKAPNISNK